jgi:dimethylaniline monooxygenase (N-oxide forming)
LVKAGAIKLFAPARVTGYGQDGRSIIVNDKEKIVASAVILATGYTSSWSKIFDGNDIRVMKQGAHILMVILPS